MCVARRGRRRRVDVTVSVDPDDCQILLDTRMTVNRTDRNAMIAAEKQTTSVVAYRLADRQRYLSKNSSLHDDWLAETTIRCEKYTVYAKTQTGSQRNQTEN